jgi:hypothetical protein
MIRSAEPTVGAGGLLGIPLYRSLGIGLWEVRSALPGRRVSRLLLFVGEARSITKAKLAELMHTSRAPVDRILRAKGHVTIESLQRAAAFVGRELRLDLV